MHFLSPDWERTPYFINIELFNKFIYKTPYMEPQFLYVKLLSLFACFLIQDFMAVKRKGINPQEISSIWFIAWKEEYNLICSAGWVGDLLPGARK